MGQRVACIIAGLLYLYNNTDTAHVPHLIWNYTELCERETAWDFDRLVVAVSAMPHKHMRPLPG